MKRHVLVLAMTLIVTGCGGGGSGSSSGSITPPADPTGIWEGYLAVAGDGVHDVGGLLIEGNLYFFSTDGFYTTLHAGTYAVSGNRLDAGTIDYDLFTGFAIGQTDFHATVDEGVNISGTFASASGASGSFSLDYSADNLRGASLTWIGGNWLSNFGVESVSIDSLGNFSSANLSGCGAYGSVRLIDPGINIYRLSLTLVFCGVLDGAYSGYAFLTDNLVFNDTLVYVVRNADRTVIFDVLTRS